MYCVITINIDTQMTGTLHATCDKYTFGWIMSQNKRLQSSVTSVYTCPPFKSTVYLSCCSWSGCAYAIYSMVNLSCFQSWNADIKLWVHTAPISIKTVLKLRNGNLL